MGINRFSAIEKNLLKPTGQEMDIVFCMSEQDIPKRMWDIRAFLGRGKDKLVMTTLSALTWVDASERNHLLDTRGDQLYLMPRLMCRPAYPISLEVIVDKLIEAECESLIVFGADGYLEPGMEDMTDLELIRSNQQKMLATYYDAEFFKTERRATGVAVGTVRFNRNFTYEPEKMTIVNCSPDSKYAHIPTTTYEGLLARLALGGLS